MDRFLKKLNGSYTVEMAMISGLWLLVIFASLLLIQGSYERAYDTALCCEGAAYGSTEAVRRTGNGVQQAQIRVGEKTKKYAAFGSKREITVAFTGGTRIPFSDLLWNWNGILKNKVIRPVLFIEGIEKARRFREGIRN